MAGYLPPAAGRKQPEALVEHRELSVLQQRPCKEQAAAFAVRVHARAGERLAARLGSLGYLARELSVEVPALLDALAPRAQRRIGFG